MENQIQTPSESNHETINIVQTSVSQPIQPAVKTGRPDGVVLVSIYHILCSLPYLFAALVLLAIPIPAIFYSVEEIGARVTGLIVMGLITLIPLSIGVLYLVSGIGLLKMYNWARWLTIALSIISLLAFPVGTLVGALIIVYLMTEDLSRAFTKIH